MINNPLLVYKLSQDLKQLEGMEIVSCFTTDTSSINIVFDDGYNRSEIEFRVVNTEVGLFLKDNISNFKGNNKHIFNEIKNDLVQNVYQFNNDRIIVFDLVKFKIVFILFGHGKSDVLITNHHFDIISVLFAKSYKSPENLKEKLNLYQNNDKSQGLISNKNLVTDKFKINYSTKIKLNDFPIEIYTILNNYFYHISFYKLIFINKLNIDTKLLLTDQNSVEDLYQKLDDFTLSLVQLDNCFIYNLTNDYIISNVSLIEKKVLFETYNIHKAISFCIYNLLKTDGLNQRKELFLKPLKRVLSKNEALLKEFQFGINLEELADKYKNFADLLMSQSNPKLKSGKSINLVDFIGENVTIPLDEKMNLIDNAHKYYNKSQKTKKDFIRRKNEIPLLEAKVNKIKEILNNLININDNKSLKIFEQNLIMSKDINVKDLKINLNQLSEIASYKNKIDLKFRKFDLSDGFTLYLGKDASNNDELTMKFGKSNDIWLHAKGVSGSHGIIKNNSTKYPPKHIIEEAAEICAYFSQSRNANYVPVIYTFKKNVTKPKGAAKGAVRVNKEDVIMVTPKTITIN